MVEVLLTIGEDTCLSRISKKFPCCASLCDLQDIKFFALTDTFHTFWNFRLIYGEHCTTLFAFGLVHFVLPI